MGNRSFGQVINRVGKITGFVHNKGYRGFAMRAAAKVPPSSSFLIQGARPYHVQVESLSCCFPREYSRELVSFVRHGRQESFDLRHVTRSPPIGNVFGLSGISILFFKNRQGKFLQVRAGRRKNPKDGTFRSIPEHGVIIIFMRKICKIKFLKLIQTKII